jgi:Protein of unknown function (DUF4232)
MIATTSPPSHDELEALIKEARVRQLRRRLLGAAGIAIAAAIGLGAYAITRGFGQAGSVAGSSPNSGAPPCRSSQLSTGIGFQGATQSMLGGATLRNSGGSICSLPTGRPAFRIVWNRKSLAIPVRQLTGSTAPPWPRARLLAPGRSAFIVMQWRGLPVIGGALPPRRLRRLCNRTTGASFEPQVALRYRSGLSLTARATGLILPACGPLHSSWIEVSRPLTPQ